MDKKILRFASPTISGIKTGNLFKVYISEYDDLDNTLLRYNNLLNTYGIYLLKIYNTDIYALIYIFRINHLKNDLFDKKIKEFLISYGYNYSSISTIISSLKNNFYRNSHIPHEVGLFLGYPLEDVIGFITNKGKNYKISGYWKVYGDPIKYGKIFENYKKCRDNNLLLYDIGFPLESLIYS